ncbi:MAG TPA: polysaccharide deacetylase family protein [Micromonosporaceae bacterium]|nr:polysaccharide deacetylase family protein [Micromonosporaceae bacterium]
MTRRRRLIAMLAAGIATAIVGGAAVMVACADAPPVPPLADPTTTAGTPSPAPTTSATPTPTTTSPPTATSAPTTTGPITTTTRPPSPTTSKPPVTTAPGIPASLRGKDIEVIPTSSRIVALTFDGGANTAGLSSILSTLDKEGVRATFFLTGDFARRYPDAVAAIVAHGHRLGNHTATHPNLPKLSDSQIVSQLATAESQILAAGGTDPRPLFRFPFGDRDARTIAVVNNAGYVAVRWTVDTLGWKGTKLGGITPQIVVDRVVNAARPGEIVLMHVGSNPDDGTTLDADALPTVIARLRAMGYQFVTLDVLVGSA